MRRSACPSCCGSRLRDITIEVLDGAGAVVWTSALLNPNNVLGGPADLKVLHPLKHLQQLRRLRVNVEAAPFERDQQLVRRLQRRETTGFGLPFDAVAAGCRVGKHDPRQPLEAETRAKHRPHQPPRRIEQKHHQAPSAQIRQG